MSIGHSLSEPCRLGQVLIADWASFPLPMTLGAVDGIDDAY